MEARSHQGLLEAALRKIFPSHNIATNSKKEAIIKSSCTGRFRELDIWIPSLKLGFEFQDEYHYSTTWFSNATLASIQQKDNVLVMSGVTLVEVPCWWDASLNSLVATVLFHRPDLAGDMDHQHYHYHSLFYDPIALNPQFYYFKGEYVPGVGELMLASFPEVGEFQKSISFSNSWWMGEKYDGVRFCWNSNTAQLDKMLRSFSYTRSGMEFYLGSQYNKLMPSIFIDGELWMGRGDFSSVQKLVYTRDSPIVTLFRMIMFDVPSYDVESLPFELRYQLLLDNVPIRHPFIVLAQRALCIDRKHLSLQIRSIMEDNGEGVILRKPRSVYSRGRSPSLLKFKASRGDHEAIVINIDKESVQLKMPDSQMHVVPVSNVEVTTALQQGDIVSLYYEKFSRSAVPVAPKIYRIRKDVTWDDVIRSAKSQQLNILSSSIAKTEVRAVGRQGKGLRNTLTKIARAKNLDPLDPETWYNLSSKDLINSVQQDSNIFRVLRGGYAQTISTIFPDIGINVNQFPDNTRTWVDVSKRRRWFETYAKAHNFDPLLSQNWLNTTIDDASIIPILQYYSGDLVECLYHLFPEIKFSDDILPSSHWNDPKNRRRFFEKFAEREGFDPLIASNWYLTEYSTFHSVQGADDVLKHYRGSFRKALMQLFSELRLDYAKIPSKFFGFDERRKILLEYAQSNGFDPLVPSSWATVTATSLTKNPSTKRVFEYYGGVKKMLMAIFKFDDVPTVVQPKNYWRSQATRQKFFENFATKNGFNARDAKCWYSFTRADILKDPDAGGVLNHHGGSFSKALIELFPDIGLDITKFVHLPRVLIKMLGNFLNDMNNVRSLFEQYAKKNNFDPLNAENWYNIQSEDITNIKGGWAMLRKFNSSVSQALLLTFPNIGLRIEKFNRLPHNYWNNFDNARLFLEQFAREQGFDPLIPHNWYSVPHQLIKKKKITEYDHHVAILFPRAELE